LEGRKKFNKEGRRKKKKLEGKNIDIRGACCVRVNFGLGLDSRKTCTCYFEEGAGG
jgi:hypothetical protein